LLNAVPNDPNILARVGAIFARVSMLKLINNISFKEDDES